jgi:hypothetical protein
LAVLFTSGQATVAASAAATKLAAAMIRLTLAGRLRAWILSIVAVLALARGGAWLALDRIAEPGKPAAAASAGCPTPLEDTSPGAGSMLDDERRADLGTATAVISGKKDRSPERNHGRADGQWLK